VEGEYKQGRGELVKCGGYDTVNLETLMVMAYNLKLKDMVYQGIYDVTLPITPEIPLKADLATVDRVKKTWVVVILGSLIS
jgi:hypothetical protein